MTQLEKIKKDLKRAGIYVKQYKVEEDQYLTAKRKPKSKKFMFELGFNKKGKLTNIIVGLKPTECVWIDITLLKK